MGGSALPQLARLFDRPGAEGSGVTETMEGESVYTGFTRLSPDGWIIALGAPTAEMERVLLRSVAWYVAGILGSSLACLLLARRISRRIGDGVNEMKRVSIGRTTVYQLIRQGEFPQPVKICGASRWVLGEVTDWIESLMSKRRQGT